MWAEISNFMICLVEILCLRLFLESFLDENYRYINKKIYRNGLVFFVSVLAFLIAKYFENDILYKNILAISIYVCWGFISYDVSIQKILVLTVLFYGFGSAFEYLAYFIVLLILNNPNVLTNAQEIVGRLVIMLGLSVLFMVTIILKRIFGKKNANNMKVIEWMRFLIFPLFTIVVIYAAAYTMNDVQKIRQAVILYIISFGIVLMNFFVFYLLNDIMKRNEDARNRELLEVQSKDKQEVYQALLENLRKQQSKNHEYFNHLMCMEGYLERKEYDELDHYLKRISGNYRSIQKLFDTNNTVVNTIVNAKYQEMQDKNIVLLFQLNDLSGLYFSDEDIVVMLSNLLNNAIEATEKCEEKRAINLKFMTEGDYIVLSVKNNYQGAVIRTQGGFMTTKTDVYGHGLGLRNVLEIVTKYDGIYTIKTENNEFAVSALFPLKPQ